MAVLSVTGDSVTSIVALFDVNSVCVSTWRTCEHLLLASQNNDYLKVWKYRQAEHKLSQNYILPIPIYILDYVPVSLT